MSGRRGTRCTCTAVTGGRGGGGGGGGCLAVRLWRVASYEGHENGQTMRRMAVLLLLLVVMVFAVRMVSLQFWTVEEIWKWTDDEGLSEDQNGSQSSVTNHLTTLTHCLSVNLTEQLKSWRCQRKRLQINKKSVLYYSFFCTAQNEIW